MEQDGKVILYSGALKLIGSIYPSYSSRREFIIGQLQTHLSNYSPPLSFIYMYIHYEMHRLSVSRRHDLRYLFNSDSVILFRLLEHYVLSDPIHLLPHTEPHTTATLQMWYLARQKWFSYWMYCFSVLILHTDFYFLPIPWIYSNLSIPSTGEQLVLFSILSLHKDVQWMLVGILSHIWGWWWVCVSCVQAVTGA